MHVNAVHDAVRTGRVVRAKNYHAGKRGYSWLFITTALERCYHVAPDDRAHATGTRLHPHGWYALAGLPHRRRLRIDFNATTAEDGGLLLIVTAYQV